MAGGCAGTPVSGGSDRVRQAAVSQGFSESRIETDHFVLLVMHRGLEHAGVRPVVYIEGDGRGFITRHRVASDPTPRDPVALRLAMADPSPAVIYIARPCQYILSAECGPQYWTTHRYAEAVVDAIDQAISRIDRQGFTVGYGLVGYSGGGVVAALLAQRRDNIDWLLTLSAPLDHAAWTAHHGDTPLSGSLNPADRIEMLAEVPQLHMAGGRDGTVPPHLIETFVRQLPPGTPVEYRSLPGMTHSGWPDQWRELICGVDFWQPACGG